MRSVEDEVVEFTTSIYRGDRYRLVSELGANARPPQLTELAERFVGLR
jgi:hypothetical protein